MNKSDKLILELCKKLANNPTLDAKIDCVVIHFEDLAEIIRHGIELSQKIKAKLAMEKASIKDDEHV
jgi:hypothetical protein